MQKETIFLGPPGTGKTTKLIATVEQEMANGIRPDKIAFVSFTKKAADEAADRACEKFKLPRKALPYFRTLHSLAFRELGLRRGDVIGKTQYKELSNLLGVEFTGYYQQEEGLSGGKEGDVLLFIDTLARTRMVSLEQQWRELNTDINYATAKQFHDVYAQYRKDVAMYDYTDFLEQYIDQCSPLNIDVAVIDEAQDLSALQWKVARLATQNAKRVYIAGDDDQAIYQWSGADIEYFLNLKGEKIVLDKSYRLPKKVFDLADRIIGQISHRYRKNWCPRDDDGQVIYHNDPAYIKFDDYPGDWLLLARNNYFLPKLRDLVEDQGVVYSYRGKLSIDPNHVLAIKIWERLRNGREVDAEHVRLLFEYTEQKIKVQSGAYTREKIEQVSKLTFAWPWYISLVGIHYNTRNYYRTVLARKNTLDVVAEAHISAIHGAKGGEADNVLLLSDMSYNSYSELQHTPDSEHRVFYVGITRARNRLHIVQPQTNRYYII